MSGFSSSSLKAEPLWATAARQGLDVTVVSATQSHPFAPYLEEKRFGGNFGSALTLLDGFQTLRIPAAVYGPRDLPLKAPSGWREPLPPHSGAAREFALAVEGARVDGLVYDDPDDPTQGYDTMALSVGKRATGATILKPRALGTSAGAFGRVTVSVPEGTLSLHFRLFALSPDGSEILLFRSEAGVLKSSRPTVAAAALADTGGFTPNGGDDVYKAGGFGAPLWKGGDGTAERRYLETVALVARQFDRLLDFGADRTRWELLIGYLPYPDEALHLWLGYLDPSLPGYDAALAARLRPIMDRVLGIVDRFVASGRARAERTGAVFAVGADHGMMAVNRQVRFNVALQRAGLLAIGSGGAIDLARTRAVYFPGNSGYFLVNRLSRAGGIVDERGEEARAVPASGACCGRSGTRPQTSRSSPASWTRIPGLRSRRSVAPRAETCTSPWRRATRRRPTFRAGSCEPVPPRGEHLLSPERPAMLASFVIAGPGVTKGADLGLVRQVDVAPTLERAPRHRGPGSGRGLSRCAPPSRALGPRPE